MDNDLMKRAARERTWVDVDGSAEALMYWKTALCSTEAKLRAAVNEVGVSADAVRDYLRNSPPAPARESGCVLAAGRQHLAGQMRDKKSPERGRILFGDDNEVIQAVVREAAEARGFEVTCATTGAATLAMALATQPDLIVLDIQFPDADGRDVLGKLKGDQRTAHIPVVVWSGRKGHDSDRRISLDLGAEDYVEKNEAELLMGKLERVLLRLADARRVASG